jgi:flagellar M-ring protein FliF
LPGGAIAGASDQLGAPAPAAQLAGPGSPRPMDYEAQVAAARTLVAQDPKLVAQVVKNWVGTDE